LGGLSKKAFQLEKMRHKETQPFLTLDGGGLLFKGNRLAPGLTEQNMTTARAIVDAYNIMAYDAVGIAARDLAAGLDFLNTMKERAHFAWLSANLVDKATGKPLFTPSISRKVGDLNIAVIGLTGTDAGTTLSDSDHAVILPWPQVLPPLIATLAADNDMVVLLSSCSPAENEAIARELRDIRLIIQAGVGVPYYTPKRMGNALVCQSDKQGKFLGVLQVNWQRSKVWDTDEKEKLITVKKNELNGIVSRLKQYQQRLPPETLQSHWGYQQLLKIRDQEQAEIDQLEAEIGQMLDNAEAPSTFTNRLIPLDVSLPDDKAVLDLVRKAKQQVNEIGRAVAASRQSRADKPSSTAGDRPIPLPYAGVTTCSGCHRPQANFWEKTPHAKAYRTLVSVQQNHNPDCLGCHVTYKREEVRRVELLSLPAELLQVGCETCHGPGSKHAGNPESKSITRRPAAVLCLGCHTNERDGSFNFDHDVKLIACPAS
jgi:hypothetical protein